MDSDDMLRRGWIRFDFLPQPRDMIINRARNRAAFIAPNFIKQLIACDDLTAMPDQVTQDLKFARRKIQCLPAFARRILLKIQLHLAKCKILYFDDFFCSSSQMRPDTRE